MESGEACDEAELRCILVEEMFALDQQTVLSRLVMLFSSPSVSLRSDGKRLEKILQGITVKEKVFKAIVLLGESGAGKSSLGNCLLGRDFDTGFEESSDSCTKKTSGGSQMGPSA